MLRDCQQGVPKFVTERLKSTSEEGNIPKINLNLGNKELILRSES